MCLAAHAVQRKPGPMTSSEKTTALEDRGADGAKRFSPSAARNRDPIRDVLLQHLPSDGAVLEIGSGTGEHAVHLASAAPRLRWIASDPDPTARASIAAHFSDAGADNLDGPYALNVSEPDWDKDISGPFNAVISINMIHIAPFTAAEGLFAGAGRLLEAGGKLLLYGPFSKGGVHTAASNEAFDASLKARDPRWGVRDLEHDLAPLAQEHALVRDAVVEMPANNFTVIFVKR